jgi:hypothetical protein
MPAVDADRQAIEAAARGHAPAQRAAGFSEARSRSAVSAWAA